MEKWMETKTMKLTKATLKRIIKEELENVLSEEELEEGWKQNLALALGLMGAGAPALHQDTSPAPSDQVTQTDSGYLNRTRDNLSKAAYQKEFNKIQKDFTEATLALKKNSLDGAAAKKQTQAVKDLKDLNQRSGMFFQLK